MDFSPYTWMFWDLGTPANLAAPFWEAALASQAQAYNPSIRFKASALMEKGDDVSVFEYGLEAGE